MKCVEFLVNTGLACERIMFWILLAFVVLATIYWWLKEQNTYWLKRGVPQGKPVPLFGDFWFIVFRTLAPPDAVVMMYNAAPSTRYVGVYEFMSPALLLRDPELIKQITVKDFDHFLDHKGFVQGDADVLMSKHLFALTGQKWREMRSTLSPSFTSSKMKYLFSVMSESGQQFVNHFLEKDEKVITLEMKDALSRFANDVIGNTVFGFKCDSLKEPKNEFFEMTQAAMNLKSFRTMLVFMGYVIIPKIYNFFKVTLLPARVIEYYLRVVKQNIESREKLNIKIRDMLTLLLEARKNRKEEEPSSLPDTGFATVQESEVGKNQKLRQTKITDEDIAAQAFFFIFAGFDTVSTLVAFAAYELAVNPEVQERLQKEVDSVREQCDGKITYEAITSMEYMDMVVSEALRMYPSAIMIDRVCTKPYTIEAKASNETPIHLKEGDMILIPMFAIQRDPKNFRNPDRFVPERFNEENRSKIAPYSYIPFGSGPRSCIGSRFALLETKILFYYLLSSFKLIPVEKTQIPIRFDPKALAMGAEKGIWLGLKKRDF